MNTPEDNKKEKKDIVAEDNKNDRSAKQNKAKEHTKDKENPSNKLGKSEEGKLPDYIEEDYQEAQDPRYNENAEFMDHQDTMEVNDDDFQQPQSMSQGLSSIYPGKASSRKDREELAEERRKEMTDEDNRRKNREQHQGYFPESSNQMDWKDNQNTKRYMDTERGNYARHRDYQDRQGRERGRNLENEYPAEERNRYFYGPDRYERQRPDRYEGKPHAYGDTPSWKHDEYRDHLRQGDYRRGRNEYRTGEREPHYPSARQNQWDDNTTDYRGYEETDYDDREVRRRRDEGMKPWDSDVNYDSDYDRRDYYREGRGRFDERRRSNDYGQSYHRPRHYRDAQDRRREHYPERERAGNYDRWRREEDYRRDFREEDYGDNPNHDRYYDSRNIDRGRRRYRRDDW